MKITILGDKTLKKWVNRFVIKHPLRQQESIDKLPPPMSGKALIALIDEINPDPEEWAEVSRVIRDARKADKHA